MSEYLNSLHRSTGRRQGQTQGFLWGVIFGVIVVFALSAGCHIEDHHPLLNKLYVLGIGAADAYDLTLFHRQYIRTRMLAKRLAMQQQNEQYRQPGKYGTVVW